MLYSIKDNYFYNLCNTLIDIPFVSIISESLHVLLCLALLVSISYQSVLFLYIFSSNKKKYNYRELDLTPFYSELRLIEPIDGLSKYLLKHSLANIFIIYAMYQHLPLTSCTGKRTKKLRAKSRHVSFSIDSKGATVFTKQLLSYFLKWWIEYQVTPIFLLAIIYHGMVLYVIATCNISLILGWDK